MRTDLDDGACSGHSMVGTTKNCCSELITNNQRNKTKRYHSSQYQKHFLPYSQNIHYKISHLPICQGILKNMLLLCLILLIVCVRDSVCTYLNQVAVHVEGGLSKADEVAFRHGFINMGKIGGLTDKYLFEHARIQKRSATPNHEHVSKLAHDSDILWFEQQFAKKRTKRDVDETLSFNDPLYNKQWYLHGGGHGGFDMNIIPAWKDGYTGQGIVISILDDGIEKDHPDLVKNYDSKASYDVNGNDGDPTPRYDPTNENRHGTRCAGEVSATANNSACGIGIAYNSKIGGVRMLDGFVTDSVEAASLGLNPQHIDIYSASWGPDDNGQVVDGPGPLATEAFLNGIEKGRNGLGNIFVWASGNGGNAHDSCNCDGYTNSIYTLSVSSTSKNGLKPWYLEECSSTIATTYSSGAFGEPQIVTVDLRGKCTTSHTGTSASAPLAAGIVALALEANNELTWRDVQYITVLTARPEPMVDGEWTQNALGREVSLRYGYGLMDAAAMVKMAKIWTTLPEKHICEITSKDVQSILSSNTIHKSILHVDGCQDTSSSIKFLEHVQAQISLHYSRRGDLRINLTSPNGTQSTLLPPRPNDWQAAGFNKWPFLSVHFWGESPQGEWILEIENVQDHHHNNEGVLIEWKLVLHGTAEYPVKLKDTKSTHNRNRDHIFNGSIETASMSSDSTVSQSNSSTPANKSLIVCHEQCANDCYGPSASECYTCKHFRNGPNGPCVAFCSDTSYGNPETGECYSCDSSCKTCSGPLPKHCQSCKDGHYLTENNVCSKICNDGFFIDQKEKRCKSCQSPCTTCEFSAKNCTSCLQGYNLSSGLCIQTHKCDLNEYRIDDVCYPCFHLCATCDGPSSSQCNSCLANFVIKNGSCTPAPCSAGFYQDITGGRNSPICKRCHKYCLRCYGPSTLQCISCRPTYKMINKQCIKDSRLISCDEPDMCLNHTTKSKSFRKENEKTFIILSVLFSIFTLVLIAAVAIIYYAQSNNKLCWAYRYQKVVVLFDENTNRFLLTNGDSGDEEEEKFEIK